MGVEIVFEILGRPELNPDQSVGVIVDRDRLAAALADCFVSPIRSFGTYRDAWFHADSTTAWLAAPLVHSVCCRGSVGCR